MPTARRGIQDVGSCQGKAFAPGVSAFRLRRARDLLRSGGVLAYPTEGVFGVGCDPGNQRALERVVALKGRPRAKGLILIAASEEQFFRHALPLPPEILARIRVTLAGPVTWVVPARDTVSSLVTGGRPTLAARITTHPQAQALCLVFGGALVSTSANLSGRPPARTALAVRKALGERVDAVFPGCVGSARGPSIICDALSGTILRENA